MECTGKAFHVENPAEAAQRGQAQPATCSGNHGGCVRAQRHGSGGSIWTIDIWTIAHTARELTAGRGERDTGGVQRTRGNHSRQGGEGAQHISRRHYLTVNLADLWIPGRSANGRPGTDVAHCALPCACWSSCCDVQMGHLIQIAVYRIKSSKSQTGIFFSGSLVWVVDPALGSSK